MRKDRRGRIKERKQKEFTKYCRILLPQLNWEKGGKIGDGERSDGAHRWRSHEHSIGCNAQRAEERPHRTQKSELLVRLAFLQFFGKLWPNTVLS